MCTYSAIGDNWTSTFPQRWPQVPPAVPQPPHQTVTWVEFMALKKEVEELRELLAAAKRFDEATGQKDCEVEEKIAFIRKVADWVGVDMRDVLKP